jgi:PBSX family phage terminase large subunit
MKLSRIQSEVAQDTHRFKCVIAGRRAGKTWLAMRELCYQAREPNKLIWYITSSYRAAKMILWKEIKQRLIDLNWVSKINESELTITLDNGSQICLKGAENAQSLRGISLSYCVIDEAALVSEDTWKEVIRPALADQQGGAMFITTPLGKGNWTFELYQQEKVDPTNWRSWQFTTLEGGFVSEEEIEAAKSDMSEAQFRQEFLASWENLGQQVAWAFNREKNVVDLPQLSHRNLIVGADFNVSPICACVMVREKDVLYVIDEIQMYSSNTNELANEIKVRYPHSRITIMPDPSGSARKTSANGQTDHTILQNAGFRVCAPRRHDAVRDRINILNARLCSADGNRHLFLSKRCKYTINSLEKYCFKSGTQQPDKDSGFDHMFDALSYAVAWEFGLKRDLPPARPERWGSKVVSPYQQI